MKKLLVFVCGLALLASCTADAPPESSRRLREPQDTAADDEMSKEAGAEDHSEHAPETPTDDGSKPSTGADVFSGAPAYASGAPVHNANEHHATSNTGKDCFSCHNDHAPALKFAGTVYRGTQPAPNVQVRVVDASGKVQGSAYSDGDGNFWVTGAPLTSGRAGMRSASTKKSMEAAVTTGSCNATSCHGPMNRLQVP